MKIFIDGNFITDKLLGIDEIIKIYLKKSNEGADDFYGVAARRNSGDYLKIVFMITRKTG